MKERLKFNTRTAPAENVRYEAEEAKLRTGKYKGLRAYKSLLDGSDLTRF